MKKTIYAASLLVALALSGCGKKAGEEFVGDLEKLKNEMCACKDKECADKVDEKMGALMMKAAEKYKSEKDIDKGVAEKLDKLDDEYDACKDKISE